MHIRWLIILLAAIILTGCDSSREIVFVRAEAQGGDLFLLRGEEIKALTQTGGKIYEFSTAANGESLIFSRYNDSSGLDIWQISSNGNDARQLVACGADWCQGGVLSPDGSYLAYSRIAFSSATAGSAQAEIWILDMKKGENAPLDDVETGAGEQPVWSPDGARLAYYDPLEMGIKIVNMSDRSRQFLDAGYVGGSWSPDGKALVFTAVTQQDLEDPLMQLYIADIEHPAIREAGKSGEMQIDFSTPMWSPDGKWLAVGWRYAGGPPGKQIKLIQIDTGEEIAVAEDLTYSHTAYQWSPDGESLVYQRTKLGDSKAKPEIWVWEWESRSAHLLVRNGSLPHWLK